MRKFVPLALIVLALGRSAAVNGQVLPENPNLSDHPGTPVPGADVPHPVVIKVDGEAKPISPDLFGIFFEDLNYAADGGLYAELLQNRSFEYQATEQPTWNALTGWELTKRGDGAGGWAVEDAAPVHPGNPHYVMLDVNKPGDGVGLANAGVDGIPVKAGESYDVSFFARQFWVDRPRGADDSFEGRPMPVSVRLESKDGTLLGEAALSVTGRGWARYTASITPDRSDEAARFVLLGKARGGIALDEISLFPHATFHGRPNGLRADLAQAIADLHPKFVRFPGGCLAHGDGIGNFYRWKDTIGPVEQRRGQKNIWHYHQSVGLGYFEYFQFCEDIGAKPLPVLPAAVSCQNSDRGHGTSQQCVPLPDMPAYIQDVLDLIEWANGPADSPWGAKRAAAGHPAPFHLEYLGIGNEDHITPGFRERFQMIYEAVRAKHPEITVVGTVGPAPDGPDFDAGWQIASELHVPIVDEHYYKAPAWFWQNLRRYDSYDRSRPEVYVGEYAAHDIGRKSTLRAALAEAAHMTALERNGDVVRLASYAPLLSRLGHTQWLPDLIYFDGSTFTPSISYYVQQLFGTNGGNQYLPTTVSGGNQPSDDHTPFIAASCVIDQKTGDRILKIVSNADLPQPARIDLAGAGRVDARASCTVLGGEDPNAVNPFGKSAVVLPKTSPVQVAPQFSYDIPPHSLSVIRMHAGR